MLIPAAAGRQSAGKGLRSDAHLRCESQPGAPAHPLGYRVGETPGAPQEFGHPLKTLAELNANRIVTLIGWPFHQQSKS